MLPIRNKKRLNSTNFQIHVNCVAMETKMAILIIAVYRIDKGLFSNDNGVVGQL